ncbi:uncharacterized protein [Oscarella lobularis]|uniref:uncharacterized protein isoform X2 n=1 Tax=Oscarella lobularis TaxID=121494 RepID=UPI00331330A2
MAKAASPEPRCDHESPSNESYMQIETQILSSAKLISIVPQNEPQDTEKLERELEHLRKEVSKLQDERAQCHQVIEEQRRHFEEEKQQLTEQRSGLETRCRNQLAAQRHAFETEKEEMAQSHQIHFEEMRSRLETRCTSLQRDNDGLRIESAAQRHAFEAEKEEMAQSHQTQMRTVEATLAESKQSLDQFLDVLSIRANEVRLTNDKLGSGAYADAIIGHWHGMPVAVKRFHDLITTPRTIPTYQQEVLTASRLHHPNIIRVCGAVMEDGIPFQIVSELLEGSVSEVIDAAHSSPCYLSHYEQLSIVVEMTSAIAYLHGLKPRPYVHADIRPSNVLVTRDMKVKVADLGAAHLVESSKSAGPLSPQYLAPERMPPASGRSSLPSDVFSLGVPLIEIFTGVGPIPEQRNGQLMPLRNRRRLHVICSRTLSGERERPTSEECLTVLITEIEELARSGIAAVKRMVKGKFKGEGANRRHKVALSDSYHS